MDIPPGITLNLEEPAMRIRLNNPSISIDDTDFSGGAAWVVVHRCAPGQDGWDMEIRPAKPGNALHRTLLLGPDAHHPLLVRASDTVRWFEGRVRVSSMGPGSLSVACVGMGPLRSILSVESFVGAERRNRA